jgi:hypothetical protein
MRRKRARINERVNSDSTDATSRFQARVVTESVYHKFTGEKASLECVIQVAFENAATGWQT